jgi:hypothetical protein
MSEPFSAEPISQILNKTLVAIAFLEHPQRDTVDTAAPECYVFLLLDRTAFELLRLVPDRQFRETFVLEGDYRRGVNQANLRSQRGEGKLKALIYTAILVSAIFATVKILPAYISNYQLSDKMQELARFGVVNRYKEEQVRDEVFKTVKDLDIPVKREDIKVSVDSSAVKISLDYTVPVDLIVYKMDLHFRPSSEGKSIL